jgi:glycosyltransferase involved in cell wall biosynthesis
MELRDGVSADSPPQTRLRQSRFRPPDRSTAPMRIALITDWFAEKMGYAENCLPKALATLGHDVHVIASDGQVYFNTPDYAETYGPFLGPPVVPTGTVSLDGYTLHRLPHRYWRGHLRIGGLYSRLRAIRPDVVQAFEVANLSTREAALAQPLLGYKLFLESHVHASVFGAGWQSASRKRRLRRALNRRTVGAYVSWRCQRCYPISEDASEIADDLYGIARSKIEVCSLGVDTQLFRPPVSRESPEVRRKLRAELGFADTDIVCIYTGRFSASKGPQILADAIGRLAARGEPFKGLFVGGGTEAEVAGLRDSPGCRVVPFVPTRDLPPYYWAGDIGVWPKQESTSQLDAAASGLPIILSDRITVVDRVEGNGLLYREGDATDLAARIESLRSPQLRRQLGEAGSHKIASRFSWLEIAESRAADYAAALSKGGSGSRAPTAHPTESRTSRSSEGRLP